MPKTWKQYQEDAANFFRKLGLKAYVEYQLEGVRGSHKIDVYAEGSYHGIDFKWVVECKAWKTNVPKEKIMALSAIIQDVGADRGFLLSEIGFQSGAIRSASKSNITLTSLKDLILCTENELTDAAVGKLAWRLHKARTRLRDIKKKYYDDEHYPPTMEPLGKLSILELALMDALEGVYPNVYYVKNDIRYEAHSLDELLTKADELISYAENWEIPK